MKIKEITCGILFAAMLFSCLGIAGYIEHNYTKEDCKVVWVGNGIVRVEDKCGYLWEFEGSGYDVGMRVDVKMHTNCTHNTIADDYVTGVC